MKEVIKGARIPPGTPLHQQFQLPHAKKAPTLICEVKREADIRSVKSSLNLHH